MADITPQKVISSPPDRRLLATLTQDPKLIRYLENLYFDIAGSGQDNFEILLGLVINAAEIANSAQSTANIDKQEIEDLALAIQALEITSAALQVLGVAFSDIVSLVQAPDQAIQALQRKVDELEGLIVEFRAPIFPVPTPLFSPSLVSVTAAYSVLSGPPYQPLTVRADATTAALTVTLPGSPTTLQLVNVKKIDATANAVTVSGGAINIDGVPSVAIGSQYTNLQVQFNGATWDVL